jgi:hypothetical protein
MNPKEPVLLLVLVETARLRWFVAAIDRNGQSVPLLRSEVGDLETYLGLDFDEQLAFLRHRFCGALQRGCDRIWARGNKASHFIFVFEGLLPEPTGKLTQTLSAHLAEWMLNPPVVVFCSTDAVVPGLEKLAGQLDSPSEALLLANLAALLTAQEHPEAWELSRKKSATQ